MDKRQQETSHQGKVKHMQHTLQRELRNVHALDDSWHSQPAPVVTPCPCRFLNIVQIYSQERYYLISPVLYVQKATIIAEYADWVRWGAYVL